MKKTKICVIGLGYVGLPLAVAFGEKYPTVGFDIDKKRIRELKKGKDRTNEVSEKEFERAKKLKFTSNTKDIKSCNIFIIAVPTPIDESKKPDLKALLAATETVASVLKKGDIVVYESTVFPGCTEEVCVPILEKISGLKLNRDFFCGYSPERINPGDKKHRLKDIVKVVSGSTQEVAYRLSRLYSSIVKAGTYIAPSIKVAEAAKVIENIQRDVNIALVNELSLIFDKMAIPTKEVIDAASTKWNFLKFEPGLVGGHCIGVDPYYLTYKAQLLGHHPEMILAGRRINDQMGFFIAQKTVKLLIGISKQVKGAKVLLAGFTFKENCPDVRNTKVIDIYTELKEFGCEVYIFDPVANAEEAEKEYKVVVSKKVDKRQKFDAIIVAVRHEEFSTMFTPKKVRTYLKEKGVFVDVKSFFYGKRYPKGIVYWSP